MSGVTLGIDLGCNSIGWAIIDEERMRLVGTGVRVFPEGVDRDQQGGELSKGETRRTKRGVRRQATRRARRKLRLRALLTDAGLWPADADEQTRLLSIDPYELRRRALTERLAACEFGRVLIHLNQRRGFRSNRKSDPAKKAETSKMLKEISELAGEIQADGHRTLGEHLAALHEDPHRRIRKKHTRREMYENEFNELWAAQQKHHPELLTGALRDQVRDIIFFQLPMRWPQSAVGHCPLEAGCQRCPRADRLAQRYRLLQEVNNLRLLDTSTNEERGLSAEEREKLIRYLSTAKEGKFEDIRKHLRVVEHCKFKYEERTRLLGMQTDAALAKKEYFGKAWWKLPDERKDEIVLALIGREEDEVVRKKAMEDWGLDEQAAGRLPGVYSKLPPGYMSFSRKAIEKLLPHLERGLPLTAEGKKPSALREAGYPRPDEYPIKIRRLLPEPPNLPNPIVRHALHEVRILINAIICEYGKPARIHIELAREIKGSLQRRQEILKENRRREQERDQAKREIEELGHKWTSEAILRYRLWEEQDRLCIYSGQCISLAQLFGGEVHIDHILPRSRSLDNSFANKVVCFRSANADKGDQSPYEWLARSDPSRYDQVLQRARKLPFYGKFSQKTVNLDDFINRQLTDTAYISREVAKYVRCLGAEVVCTKGQITAELRRLWGLDTILSEDWQGHKNRDDHRHHAVDAIVVALTDRSRLQQLARSHRRYLAETQMPSPWHDFRTDVQEAVNAINVSHRVQRKVHGELHEAMLYWPTENDGYFVKREDVERLSPTQVCRIRDPAIKKIIVERLRLHGFRPGRREKPFPKNVWTEPGPLTMPSGVPIKKVRVVRKDETIQAIRAGTTYVKPGSNHHVCIFEFSDERGRTKWDAEFVPMLEAARRARDHEPIIQRTHRKRPDTKFIMSLSKNEMVLVVRDGKEELCRVEKLVATEKRIYFRHHTFAGKSRDPRGQFNKTPNALRALKPGKVTVDPLGRIRSAND